MPVELKDATFLRQQAYLAGAWVNADDGKTAAVINPATGEQVARVPKCGAAEADRAIVAAQTSL